ncbi:hypothetical protein ACN6K4_001337 [Streptomyces hayashii]|uniref:hypothetical protein n=1 Tax=Streptomyces hayashii TaxID=2839966 RepID=UPI00403C19D1
MHGSSWFKDQFGSSGDTAHKLIQGSLKHRPGSTFAGGGTKLAPYLLVLSLKSAFDGPHQHQSTFNRGCVGFKREHLSVSFGITRSPGSA